MSTSELITKVIIMTLALLMKDVIGWLINTAKSKIKTNAKTLITTVINILSKYWKILVDIVVLGLFIWFALDNLASIELLTKYNVFTISFSAAWIVYWLMLLQTDIIEKMKEHENAQQRHPADAG